MELIRLLDGVVTGDRRVREVGVHLPGGQRKKRVAVFLEFLEVDRTFALVRARHRQALALVVAGPFDVVALGSSAFGSDRLTAEIVGRVDRLGIALGDHEGLARLEERDHVDLLQPVGRDVLGADDDVALVARQRRNDRVEDRVLYVKLQPEALGDLRADVDV